MLDIDYEPMMYAQTQVEGVNPLEKIESMTFESVVEHSLGGCTTCGWGGQVHHEVGRTTP